MSRHSDKSRTPAAKAETIRRRKARAEKYQGVNR